MNGDIRSQEAQQIIHALAQLPGADAINIVSRKFPRFGPHATGTTYQEVHSRFPVQQLPPELVLPSDAEDVQITVQGALRVDVSEDLVGKVADFFAHAGIDHHWNFRAQVGQPQPDARPYQFQVFM